MQASLLDRRRAEEQQTCCTTRRLFVTLFISVVTLMFVLTTATTTTAPVKVEASVSSADVARQAMAHRWARAASPPPPPLPARPVRLLPPPPVAAVAGVADQTCHARLHTDYMGEQAPVWGLGNPGFHLDSPAECCAACQAHAASCGQGSASRGKSWWPARPELRCGNAPACNLWVYCPVDQCFAFDIHVHKKGECWLKQQRRFDGLGPNVTAPKDPHEGHQTFPQAMRNSPRSIWPWAVDPKIWAGGIPEQVWRLCAS